MTAYGPVSPDLALVATFPQLEYPRTWPTATHVVGPQLFEPPGGAPPSLPPGDDPVIVVSGSTSQDPELRLVRVALEALAEEPVRIVATTGGHDPGDLQQPANATVVEWISPRQTLPYAALTIARGGHGTVAESLAAGVPMLICPGSGDMPENGARVAWAGAGRMLPAPLLGRRTLRSATRALLTDPAPRRRAEELAAWHRAANPPARAAELIEALG
jgi:UDP:flavonoid glycosyltransferase YjiC (YdhE family)